MELPVPVSAKSYNKSVKTLLPSCSTTSEDSMKSVAKEEKKLTGRKPESFRVTTVGAAYTDVSANI